MYDRYRAEATFSPRMGDRAAAEHGESPPPLPHTKAELSTVLDLLTGRRPNVHTIVIGHSRHPAGRDAADAMTDAWQERAGQVPARVSWPETAASWLRPARRLTAPEPDAWVIAAAPLGWVQLARRLWHSTTWDPSRTIVFDSLCDHRVAALTGSLLVQRMRGATANGDSWQWLNGCVITRTASLNGLAP